MVKKLDVQVCECSDGRRFTDELDALLHEVEIAFRGPPRPVFVDGAVTTEWRARAARQLAEYAEREPRKPTDDRMIALDRRQQTVNLETRKAFAGGS